MELQTRAEFESDRAATGLLDLPKELLLNISECLDTGTLSKLRLTCKTLGAAAIDQWFSGLWHCPIRYPSCIDNLLHISQTDRLVHRLKCVMFTLEPSYRPQDVQIVPSKDQSLSDAQDAHLKRLRFKDFDASDSIDWNKVVAILKNLKRTSCKIGLDMMSPAGPERDSSWTGSDDLTVANITDRMMYAMARSSVSIDRLAICTNAFYESSVSIQSRGVYDLGDVTKNLRRNLYAIMPCTNDWEQGSGEVVLSHRTGAIKTLESSSELLKLGLDGLDLRLHSQVEPMLITSKFLQALRSSILQWLVLDTLDCTASDLAQVICKCKASLTLVALKDIRLHHPGSRLLVLGKLQECSKLEALSVIKQGSFSLMHRGPFEVFGLKHYGGDVKIEAGNSMRVWWRSREEVQKGLEYNINQIRE